MYSTPANYLNRIKHPFLYVLLGVLLIISIRKDYLAVCRMARAAVATTQTVCDYTSYYTAGSLAAKMQNPYDLQKMLVEKDNIAYSNSITFDSSYIAPYIYPPVLLVAFQNIASLSYGQGYVLWNSISAALLGVATYIFYSLLRRKYALKVSFTVGLTILFFLQPLAWYNMLIGQINIVLLFLLLSSAWFSVRVSLWLNMLAGGCLVFAGFIKLYPFIAIPFLWASANHKTGFLCGALSALVVLLFINCVWFSPQLSVDYLTLLHDAGGYFGQHFNSLSKTIMYSANHNNWGINGLFALLAEVYCGSKEPELIRTTFFYPAAQLVAAITVLVGFSAAASGILIWIKKGMPHIHWRWAFVAILFYQLLSPLVWSAQVIVMSPFIFTVYLVDIEKVDANLAFYFKFTALTFYASGAFTNLSDPIASIFPTEVNPYVKVCFNNYPTFFLLGLFYSEAYQAILRNIDRIKNPSASHQPVGWNETGTLQGNSRQQP